MTSPRIHFPPPKWEAWDGAPVVEWAGLTVPQAWRVGNRGNVSSVLIEKPACGDFLPIIDGGYSLQYSPLMVYREGKGMVLFCEMDVTGRTEADPAAEQLAGNILSYAQTWQPGPERTALYAGDAAGLAHLQAGGLVVKPYAGGALDADQVLVVAPGAGQETGRQPVGHRRMAQGRRQPAGHRPEPTGGQRLSAGAGDHARRRVHLRLLHARRPRPADRRRRSGRRA